MATPWTGATFSPVSQVNSVGFTNVIELAGKIWTYVADNSSGDVRFLAFDKNTLSLVNNVDTSVSISTSTVFNFATDGTYIYFAGGGKIQKFDPVALTTTALTANINSIHGCVYAGGFLWALLFTNGTSQDIVYKISLSGAVTSIGTGYLGGANFSGQIVTDGTYVYCSTNGAAQGVMYFNIATPGTLNVVSPTNLNGNFGQWYFDGTLWWAAEAAGSLVSFGPGLTNVTAYTGTGSLTTSAITQDAAGNYWIVNYNIQTPPAGQPVAYSFLGSSPTVETSYSTYNDTLGASHPMFGTEFVSGRDSHGNAWFVNTTGQKYLVAKTSINVSGQQWMGMV